MNELHLFVGAGGGILGGMLLGHRTVCAVEIEPYCRKVLLQRQRDGVLPWFPIWDDVRTFDGRPWRGIVDVVCGGFPCQDISAAGKGAGIDGERSGLWSEMARIIGEVRPRFAFVENSPMLASRGLGRVLGDLSEMGFDARWGVVSAADAGAPHLRERIWILANAAHAGCEALRIREIGAGASGQVELCGGAMADANEIGRHGRAGNQWAERRIEPSDGGQVADKANSHTNERRRNQLALANFSNQTEFNSGNVFERRRITWWQSEPDVGRVVNGLAHRVDRLKAIGNGQVPAVAALAWRILEGMK